MEEKMSGIVLGGVSFVITFGVEFSIPPCCIPILTIFDV